MHHSALYKSSVRLLAYLLTYCVNDKYSSSSRSIVDNVDGADSVRSLSCQV